MQINKLLIVENTQSNSLIGKWVKLSNLVDSDGGFYDEGPENPFNVAGIIVSFDCDHPERVCVTWLNGYKNSYLVNNLKCI